MNNINNKKISIMLLSFLLIASSSIIILVKADGPESQWIDKQVVHSGSNDRIPSVTVTPNGTILYVYEDRTGGDQSEKTIDLYTSYDNGSTWSHKNWFTTLPDGNISGYWFTNPFFLRDYTRERNYLFLTKNSDTNKPSYLFFKYTDDNGATWSAWQNISNCKPQAVKDSYSRVWNAGRGTVTPNGTILVPMCGFIGTDNYPYCIRSWDGTNFYNASDLMTAGGEGLNENTYAYCSNDSILCYSRRGSGAGGMAKFYSDDYGSTWNYCGVDFAGISGSRNTLFSYTDTTDTDKNRLLLGFTNASDRTDVTMTVSYDDGTTWTYSRQIQSGYGAYIDVERTSNYSIVCAYESASNTDLSLAMLNLEWVTQGNDWVTENDNEIEFISIDSNLNVSTIYSPTPTINWTIVENTAQYHLEIDNNVDFSSPEVNYTNINQYNYPSNCNINATRVSFTLPSELPKYNTYYMRVRAYTKS